MIKNTDVSFWQDAHPQDMIDISHECLLRVLQGAAHFRGRAQILLEDKQKRGCGSQNHSRRKNNDFSLCTLRGQLSKARTAPETVDFAVGKDHDCLDATIEQLLEWHNRPS